MQQRKREHNRLSSMRYGERLILSISQIATALVQRIPRAHCKHRTFDSDIVVIELWTFFQWLFSVAFALVVISDIILTTVLIVVLHRSRTGIAR